MPSETPLKKLHEFPQRQPTALTQADNARQRTDRSLLDRADDFIHEASPTRSIMYGVQRAIRNKRMDDPNYRISKDSLVERAQRFGLYDDPEKFEEFAADAADVGSDRELVSLARRHQADDKRRERLNELPIAGQLLGELVTGLADPTSIGSMGAAAKLYGAVTKGNRVRQIIAGAGIAAGEAASYDIARSVSNTNVTPEDILWTAAFGAGLGALGGAGAKFLGKTEKELYGVDGTAEAVRRTQAAAQRANKQTLNEATGKPLDESADYMYRVSDDINDEGIQVDLDDLEEVTDISALDDSVGAARVRLEDELDVGLEPEARSREAALGAFLDPEVDIPVAKGNTALKNSSGQRGARIDALGTLTTSKSPLVRGIGLSLFPEFQGLKGAAVQGQTAAVLLDQLQAKTFLRAARETEVAYRGYLKRNGLRNSASTQQKFLDDITDYIRTDNAYADKAVKASGEAQRRAYADLLEEGKRAGVFDDSIPTNRNYIPRQYNQAKIQKFILAHGIGGLEKFIAGAIRSAQGAIDPKDAAILAKALSRHIRDKGLSLKHAYGIAVKDREFLTSMLKDARVPASDIDAVMQRLTRATAKESRISQAKGRVDLDEVFEMNLNGVDVSMADLLENNSDHLLRTYVRRVTGAIALKRKIGITGTEADLARVRSMTIEDLANRGVVGDVAEREADHVEALILNIAGKPTKGHNPNSTFGRGARLLRKFNFITTMVNSGFASVPEFGMVSARSGMGTLFKNVAGLKKFTRDAATGKLRTDDPWLEFMEEYAGHGADDLTNPGYSRFNDSDLTEFQPSAMTAAERKIEGPLEAATHIVSEKISALGPITRIQKRFAALAILRDIEKWALRGEKLGDAQRLRLKDMGLTASDLKSIEKGMKKYGVSVESPYRQKTFKRTDIDAWEKAQPRVVAKLMNAINVEARRTIIDAVAADAPLFIQSDIGRIVTQFLSFAINAHTKLLLPAVRRRDSIDALQALQVLMFANLAYTSQAYIQTIGNEEARKEALAPDRILLASVGRMGQMAMTATAVDNVSSLLTGGGIFNHRASGDPTSILTGSPSARTAIAAYNLAANPAEGMSTKRVRAVQNLTPFVGKLSATRSIWDAWAESAKDNDE